MSLFKYLRTGPSMQTIKESRNQHWHKAGGCTYSLGCSSNHGAGEYLDLLFLRSELL